MRRALFPLLLAPWCLFAATATAQTAAQSSPTAAERFHAAEVRWSAHHPDGSSLHDDSEAVREAQSALWTAVADQALASLTAHRDLSADQLTRSLTTLEPKSDPKSGPRLSASAVRLAPGVFAVAFNDDVAGTVFVVGSRNGAPALLWSASQPNGQAAPQPRDTASLLRAWEPARQGEACRKLHHDDGSCGPVTGSLNSLPPDGAGHPRFLIDATYTQDMGATFSKQLSLWAWDGVAPHLLWMDRYAINADQGFGLRYNDGTLEIGEKGQFHTFFACGACDGRQLVRTLRLTDAGVDDLGTRSTVPELDAFDALFSTMAAGKPATALASPDALHTLEPFLAKAKAQSAAVGPGYISLGMLESSSVHRRGGTQEVCVVTETTGRLSATMERRGGELYVAAIKSEPGNTATCK